MAGAVIERVGSAIVDDDGFIHHDDRPSTFEAAEQIAGRRLDHRRNYAIVQGRICESVEWTEHCSGCTPDDPYAEIGMGCHECGYSGKRRRAMWVPIDGLEY